MRNHLSLRWEPNILHVLFQICVFVLLFLMPLQIDEVHFILQKWMQKLIARLLSKTTIIRYRNAKMVSKMTQEIFSIPVLSYYLSFLTHKSQANEQSFPSNGYERHLSVFQSYFRPQFRLRCWINRNIIKRWVSCTLRFQEPWNWQFKIFHISQ